MIIRWMQSGAIRGYVTAILATIFLCWLSLGTGAQQAISEPKPSAERAQNAEESQPEAREPRPPDQAAVPAQQKQGEHQAGADHKPQDQSRKADSLAQAESRWSRFVGWVEANDKFLVAFGTLILAAFTVILGLATAGLWWATRNLVKEGRRASEGQVRLAQEANRISQKALIAGRRAWLAIHEDVKLLPPSRFGEDGAICRVEFSIKNFGQTPALNVLMDVQSAFLAEGMKFQESLGSFTSEMRNRIKAGIPGHMIFPNDTATLALLWEVPGEVVAKNIIVNEADGAKRLGVFFFVGVSYKVVGDGEPHLTYGIYQILNMRVESGPIEIREPLVVPEDPFMGGEAD